ncbi:hypothetical protein [Phenylobacterium sp.]|uniref:DUF6973 domain-containing protein n=1 Tax=Phenylobacterium sp. TaxID=1871053 RepID=UPI0030F4B0F0
MTDFANYMSALRARVDDVSKRNARAGIGATALPAWDIAGKFKAGRRIADEELARHTGHHNDQGDADRHAQWSRRMANETGPAFSTLVGLGHELEGSAPRWLGGKGQPLSEATMDLMNNAQGVRAAQRGRPIDPARLQNRPLSLREAVARDLQRYEDTTPDRSAYPTTRPYEGTPERGYKDAPAAEPPRRYPLY